jgi:hypothetical protein
MKQRSIAPDGPRERPGEGPDRTADRNDGWSGRCDIAQRGNAATAPFPPHAGHPPTEPPLRPGPGPLPVSILMERKGLRHPTGSVGTGHTGGIACTLALWPTRQAKGIGTITPRKLLRVHAGMTRNREQHHHALHYPPYPESYMNCPS